MTTLSIQPPFPIFSDRDGQPLENGYVWIGTANLNPITNPIAVYWDAALTQPAAQPVRTINGYPANSGTPGRLYVNSDFSITVQDAKGSLVYSAPAATDRFSEVVISGVDSSQVAFLQAGTGAQPRTAQDKLRDFVHVKDFGAVGDGVADDTLAIQRATTAAKNVYFGGANNSYKISGSIVLQNDSHLVFGGATVTQTAYQTPMWDARNTIRVSIHGGRFIGLAESPFVNTPVSLAICVWATSAARLSVRNNVFTGFCYSALMVSSGGNSIEFIENFVSGPGAAVLGVPSAGNRNCTGVTIVSSTGVVVSNNIIRDAAQGLIIGQQCTDVVVSGNTILNTLVEHGMYIDSGVRRIAIANNTVTNCCSNGIKVQWYDDITTIPSDVTITGNVVQNVGTEPTTNGDGIVCLNSVQNTVATITGITAANPAVFTTAAAHGLTAGDIITISGVVGMVNGASAVGNVVNDTFVVATTPLSTTFTVNTYADTVLNTTGWSAYSSGGAVTKPVYGVNFTIVGNTVRTVTQDGISVRYVKNGVVSDNIVDTVSRIGFSGLYLYNVNIDNNSISNVQENGIVAFAPLKPTFIRNNSLFNCGAAGIDTSGRSSGMLIDGNGGSYILNNTIVGESTQTKMFYGIQLASGDKRQFVIDHNVIQRAESAGIVLWNDTPNVYPLKSLLRNISEAAAGPNAYSGLATAVPGRGTTWRDFFGSAVPAAGTWIQGDRVWLQTPAANGNLGWVCLVSGTPGTWVPFGVVQLSNAYTVTNPSTDRALNVSADTTAQVAAVLGTLIADLQTAGVLK